MRRFMRLVLMAGFAGSVFLSPVTAQAATQVSFSGLEYANASNCGSFAGLATANGQTAFFNAQICHTTLDNTNGATALITSGSFAIYTQPTPLIGTIGNGSVGPGLITRYGAFCTEAFPVTTNNGSINALLTHIGYFSKVGRVEHCSAFAATISGQASL